jgi:hypothetical protein
MIRFESANPFPKVDVRQHSLTEARAHSICVDRWLGLRVEEIERQLALSGSRARPTNSHGEFHTLWFGLDAQLLLTPYVELREIFSRLDPRPGETVVDLGAAYGRAGFVLGRHHVGVRFIGYEYVGERVAEGNRGLKKFLPDVFAAGEAELIHADLSAPELSLCEADYYFIYDFGTHKAIDKTLFALRRQSLKRRIQLVARGRHCRYLIDNRHPWLEALRNDSGEGMFTIYRSLGPELVGLEGAA